jgi:hypothetical protein
MAQATSLFEMLRGILFDEGERAVYQTDPPGYLASHGYDELDHQDVSEAVTLMAETLPPDQAARLTTSSDPVGPAFAGFGAVAQAPDPPGNLAPVDQAVHTINHYVATVTDGAPDALGAAPADLEPGADGAAQLGAGEVGLDFDTPAPLDDHDPDFDRASDPDDVDVELAATASAPDGPGEGTAPFVTATPDLGALSEPEEGVTSLDFGDLTSAVDAALADVVGPTLDAAHDDAAAVLDVGADGLGALDEVDGNDDPTD